MSILWVGGIAGGFVWGREDHFALNGIRQREELNLTLVISQRWRWGEGDTVSILFVKFGLGSAGICLWNFPRY